MTDSTTYTNILHYTGITLFVNSYELLFSNSGQPKADPCKNKKPRVGTGFTPYHVLITNRRGIARIARQR